MTHIRGRGAQSQPHNRFEKIRIEDDFSHFDGDEEFLNDLKQVKTEYFVDTSRSIVSENNSPDVPFRYSLNPYRGCQHGCAYCYARPTHEYYGLSAGLDFESNIFIKPDAPDLFREWLGRDKYEPQVIAFSGVTDCYQPAERQFEITRRCLEVALEANQPIGIVTKNALVRRDIDILSEMARQNLVSVAISVTSLDQSLTRVLEPRTSSPAARLETIRALTAAGIRVHLMAAPLIPGLTETELPAIMQAAANAGATSASYLLMRLPWTVKPVFLDWLQKNVPEKAERVLSRVRSVREGELNSSEWGKRMKGTGPIADQIAQTFEVFRRKYGLDQKFVPLDTILFRPPLPNRGQLKLFA